MDDIVKDFLIESRENLDRLDQELVSLESDPNAKDLLASIFRTIHTIKGSCGFLGFARLEKVAHTGESLLSKLRDGTLSLNAEITSGLLAMIDAVRRMLNEIQSTESDGQNDYPELQERLRILQTTKVDSEVATTQKSPEPDLLTPPPISSTGPRILEVEVAASESSSTPATSAEQDRSNEPSQAGIPTTQFLPSAGKIGGLLVNRGCIGAEGLALALQEQERGDQRRLGEILVSLGLCRQEDVNAAQQILETRGRNAGVETVRVGVDLLDTLMNLVGELVLARNQLLQVSNTAQDASVQFVSQRMNLIVTEVQEQVMKTRMQPIGIVWNKFPRTVRDLALNCGKEVHLEMEGQETELDRTIIEAIKDPLTHLIRNSIDHGIEMPDARRKSGKDPVGRVRLRAFQEGGKVNIEITDDGAGLNIDRIRNKAVERGMMTPQQAKQLTERETFNLIFLAGFSTAEKVTNVSGRGVGMDVVRTNIEKISGTIDLESSPGKGTTVRVRIPLTLAIVPALLVRCRGERFAIPQVSVLELVGLEDGETQQVELIRGIPVYRLRGNLLPLVYLDRELKLNSSDRTRQQAGNSIVVLQADSRQFGLVVDDVADTEEIVVKPLCEQLKGIDAYSGATIMGDGQVALILDVLGFAHHAGVASEARESAQTSGQAEVRASGETHQSLLIARNGSDGQVAIPLSVVARLEGFAAALVKQVGDREVMDYRGQIIPMVRLSSVLPAGNLVAGQTADANSIEVVIYSERGHTAGLIVDCIVDIIDEQSKIDPLATRPGVLGSFASQNSITELLDLPCVMRHAVSGLGERSEAAAAGD
jgi:two-component system chemotaxis sensor kinase CheA